MQTHVIIIDGTLSRLKEREETNAGLLYKLLQDMLPRTDLSVTYHPGIQGKGWLKWVNTPQGLALI